MTNLWITPADLDLAYQSSLYADEACRMASTTLWAMSGRKFNGTTTVTERYVTVVNSFRYQGGSAKDFYPHMVGGRIFNVPTEDWNDSAYQSDGTSSLSRIKLRGRPVTKVHLVRSGYDGSVIPEDKYYIAEHSTLIAYKGVPWPPGNIEVTYTYGQQPPTSGRMAAKVMAQELINAWSGDTCALPDRITSVTRQGVSYTVLDSQDFLENMRTGVYLIDLFIKTTNPAGALAPAKVFSPDVHKARRAAPARALVLPVSATYDVGLKKSNGWAVAQIHACTGPFAGYAAYNTADWELSLSGYSYSESTVQQYASTAAQFSIVSGTTYINLAFDYKTTQKALGMNDPGTWVLRAKNLSTGATVDLFEGNMQIIKVSSSDVPTSTNVYSEPTRLVCPQGQTFNKTLRWTDAGAPVPLAGFTAAMQVKTSYTAATAVATLTTENGGITLGASNGEIVLYLSHTATSAIAAGTYVYDLELTASGGTPKTRLLEGPFVVTPEVTTV
jgi:hypothetical protein